jgi:hypothetical protein
MSEVYEYKSPFPELAPFRTHPNIWADEASALIANHERRILDLEKQVAELRADIAKCYRPIQKSYGGLDD